MLLPAACSVYGPSLILEKPHGNLGYWQSPDDRAEWEVEVPRAGEYDVVLDFACESKSAGNVLLLLSDEGRVSFKVPGAGGWESYRQARAGRLALRAGKQTITARSDGKVSGALIDLRSVKLVPVR